MTFQAPTLTQWTDTAVTTYVTTYNNNISSISTALNSIEAELANVQNATEIQFASDWGRRISVSDPNAGVIGCYSLVFVDAGSNIFRLDADNADSVSAAYIAGSRYQHSGNLQGDWTDLALSDGTYVAYVGVDPLAPTDLSLAFSTTSSEVTLVLYQVDLTVSGGGTTYTVGDVVRESRSLLWDNTVEQLRQELPIPVTVSSDSMTQGDSYAIRAPFDCRIGGMWVYVETNVGLSTIELQDSTGTSTDVYVNWNVNPAGGDVNYQAVATAWDGVVFAAGTTFLIDVPTLPSGPTVATIGVELIPAYSVPTN